MCLIMADLEGAEHGALGDVRAWLARASRAPRDAVWMADGVAAESWQPASPVTGKLDAFIWQRPPERPGLAIPLHPADETPERAAPTLALSHAEPEAALIEEPEAPAAEAAFDAAEVVTAEPARPAEGKVSLKPVIFPQPALPDDPGSPEGIDPAEALAPAPEAKKK
jgi:HemY protein